MSSEAPQGSATANLEWLDPKEAAEHIKVKDVRTFLRWAREGKFIGYAVSGTKRHIWRFLKRDLDAALLSHPVVMSESPTVLSKKRRVA